MYSPEVQYHMEPERKEPSGCGWQRCWKPREHHFDTREEAREAYERYRGDLKTLARYFNHISHLRPG